MSEAYLAGITCEAFEVEWESVQTAKKLFEVVPPFFHELFGHCSKTGRRQQRLKVRKCQKIFFPFFLVHPFTFIVSKVMIMNNLAKNTKLITVKKL